MVADDLLLEEALKLGEKISSFSRPAGAMAKETVNSAYELTLQVYACMHVCMYVCMLIIIMQ